METSLRPRTQKARLGPNFIKRLSSWLVLSSVLTLGVARVARGTSIYWDGTGTTWNAVSDWSTASGATTPDPLAVPGALDFAIFNATTVNTDQFITLDAAQSALGLIFNSTGQVNIASGAGANTLSIGTSGITVNNGAGPDTITSAVALSGAQSWTNSSASLLTVSGNITNGANTLTLAANGAGGITLSGNFVGAGAGGATVNGFGSGVVTLSGVNTYTGTTTLTNGTLRATGNAAALGAGALSLGGGVLQLANDTGLNFGNNTTVTGNTQIVTTTVAATTGVTHTLGTLSIGAQRLTVNGGGIVTTGIQGLTFDATSLTGASMFTVNNPSLGGTTLLTLGAVNNGTFTATINGNGSVAQTGVWGSGTGGIIYNGAGTLTLNQANTFTGALSVAGGNVVGASDAGALGAGTLTLLAGNLQLTNPSGSNLTFGRNTTVSAYSTITSDVTSAGAGNTYTLGTLAIGAQQLNIRAGANVTTGPAGVTFGTTTLSVNGATFDIGANANLTLGLLAGNFNAFKTGAGTLTLSGTSTRAASTTLVTGGTVVQTNVAGLGTTAAILALTGGSTLDLATDASTNAYPTVLLGNATILSDKGTPASVGGLHLLGTLTSLGANTLTVGAGANVSVGTAALAFGAATMNANTIFSVGTGSSLTLNSTLANGGGTPTFTGSGDSTVTGVISGGGGLTKSGNGTLTLTGTNTYTGVSTISAGTVSLNNAAGLGPAAVAVLNMTGTGSLSTNAFNPSFLALSGTSGTVIRNNGGGTQTITVTPVANTTSNFAGTIQNGGGGGTLGVTVNGIGALTLSGNNTYSGITLLTAGQLNINASGTDSTNSAIGTGVVTLTTGIIDNTSGGDVTLATTNAIALNGNLTFGGSGNLNLGAGTLSQAASRTVNLLGASARTLTVQNWSNTAANVVNTFLTVPGSNSTVSIGVFNSETAGAAGTTGGISGNSTITITGGIAPTITGNAFVYNNSGTLTVSGNSTYTGATILNAGTFILENNTASGSMAASALTVGGGTFVYHGADAGSLQTLGAVTLTPGASSVQVVGGTSGTTTLTLGTISSTVVNNGTINFSVAGTGAGIGNSTSLTNGLISNGVANARGGAFTFTTGGTTSFATVSGGQIAALTGQTVDALPTSGTGGDTTNFFQTVDNTALVGATTIYSLQLNPTAGNQTISLGGQILTIASGGLLSTGTSSSTVGATVGDGALKSDTATNSDLIVHNFGTGGLTINSVIADGAGASVVTYDGTGTTTVAGTNTYTGVTLAGGGAIVKISANSALGAGASAQALTLNNATLQAGGTFGLFNGAIGTNDRPIALGAGGGTFDTQANTLTISGVISGAGNLTKTGTGTLILAGVNTNTSPITAVQNGILQLGTKTGALVGTLAATPFTMVVLGSGSNSGVLQLGDTGNAAPATVAGLYTSGNGAGNAVVGGFVSNSTLTFTGSVLTPSVFAGTLGGAGLNQNNLALSITSGQLTLSGTNTYLGNTTVTGGSVLNINSDAAIGAGTLLVNSATAVIDNTSGSARTMTNNNNVTTGTGFVFAGSNNLSFGSGTLTTTVAATPIAVNGSGTLTFGGALINNAPTGAALTLTVNGSTGTLSVGGFNMQGISGGGVITDIIAGSANVNITGPITPGFNAANALSYTGTGILTLSGANTYTGLTTMNNSGGTLRFGPGGSLNGGAGNLTLTAGTVDLNGQAVSVGTLIATAGLITNSSNTPATLTSTNLSSTTNTANISGKLSVAFGLTGAAATFSGGTYTNTGDITLSNAGTGLLTSTTNISNNGNLTLNANVAQGITLNGTLINPGGPLGTGGTITNSGSSTGLATLSGLVGSHVAAINNTSTSPLTISGALYVNPLGTTVTQSGTGLLLFGTATINGAGNLSVIDSSTTAGNITFSAVSSFAGNLTLQANGVGGTPGIITASGNINNAGTVTNSGTGTATTTISGIIGLPVTGVFQNSTSSALTLSGANTFAGGLTINAGLVNLLTSSTAAGTGTITLGDTAGSLPATLQASTTALTFANPIVLGGTSGQLTIQNNNIALTTFSGGITGSNNLVVNYTTAAADGITFSVYPVNIGGTITVKGPGTVATTFSGGIGAKVPQVINDVTSTSPLTISGPLAINPAGTTLTNNSTAVLTSSGGMTGAGDLTLQNNGATANGVTVSTGAVNISGNIINSGAGAGNALISSALGGNVINVTQNGPSNLTLSSATNAYTGITTINGGTLTASGAVNFNGGGASGPLGTSSSAASNLIVNGGTFAYGAGTGGTTDRLFTLTANGGSIANSASSNGTLIFTNTAAIAVPGAGSRTLNLLENSTGFFTFTPLIVDASATDITSLNINGSAAGAVVLLPSAMNTFTGGITITGRTLQVQSANALGTNSVTFGTGANPTLDLRNNVATNFTTNGGGNLIFNNNGIVSLSAVSASNGVTHTIGTVTIGTASMTIAHGSNLNSNNADGLAMGAVTVTGNPTFIINNGNGTAIPLDTMASLDLGGVARTVTVQGGGGTAGSGPRMVFNTAPIGFVPGSNLVVNTGTNAAVRFTIPNAFSNGTAADSIVSFGATGTGTLQLITAAGTTFNNNVLVNNSGTILVGTTAASNAITHTLGTLSIGTATLTVTTSNGNTNNAHSLTLGATTFTGNPTFTLSNTNGTGIGNLTLGPIDDGGVARTLTKNGGGNLLLNFAATSFINTAPGTIALNNGLITLGNPAALGTAPVVTGATAGQLVLNATATFFNNVTTTSAGIAGVGILRGPTSGGLTATYSGIFTVNATTTAGGAIDGGSGAGSSLIVTNSIVLGPAVTAFTNRMGTVTYGAPFSFSGANALTVFGVTGSAIWGADDILPGTTNLNIAQSGIGTLAMGIFNQTVNNVTLGSAANVATITGSGTLTINGTVTNDAASTVTELINPNVSLGGGTRTFNIDSGAPGSDVTITGGVSNGGITKIGLGILTLSGSNSYGGTGNTAILNGTLVLRASNSLSFPAQWDPKLGIHVT